MVYKESIRFADLSSKEPVWHKACTELTQSLYKAQFREMFQKWRILISRTFDYVPFCFLLLPPHSTQYAIHNIEYTMHSIQYTICGTQRIRFAGLNSKEPVWHEAYTKLMQSLYARCFKSDEFWSAEPLIIYLFVFLLRVHNMQYTIYSTQCTVFNIQYMVYKESASRTSSPKNPFVAKLTRSLRTAYTQPSFVKCFKRSEFWLAEPLIIYRFHQQRLCNTQDTVHSRCFMKFKSWRTSVVKKPFGGPR